MNALLIAYSILHLCICILIECVCVCVVYASRRVTLVIDDTENPPNRIEEA